MLSLKKYFTEGLIQFTIFLSLIGIRVDVDSYLNSQLQPFREIILGPSSAYTQTQFHNLRNTLDGYGVHPKSVDLDYYFTVRRLLSEVRALDRFHVPTTEVNAWLVHRETENCVTSTQPSSGITLENGSGLEEVSNPDTPVRESGQSDQGYGEEMEYLGAAAPPVNTDLTKEDIDLIDILWRQDIDLGAGREVFDLSNRQKENEAEKQQNDNEENGESWRNGRNQAQERNLLVDGETGESVPAQQLPVSGDQTALSLEECLRLLQSTILFGDEPEFPATVPSELSEGVRSSGQEVPATSPVHLLPPLLTDTDSSLDLEEQWQDIMSIMELQDMDINNAAESLYTDRNRSTSGSSSEDPVSTNYSMTPATPINHNVSLHQASLPSCSTDFPSFFPADMENSTMDTTPGLLQSSFSNSTNADSAFASSSLSGRLFPPQLNVSTNDTASHTLSDPLAGLLGEAMLDEISLMDLAMEEGFNPVQASQLQEEFDSDSGLSLDSGHSPASPSSSESSASSSSSSSSSSSFSEEGAVGYSTDSEFVDFEDPEGATGGYQPEYSKFCRMSYRYPSHFHSLPHLEHVSHNHTYNMPPTASALDASQYSPVGKKAMKEKQSDFMDKQVSRDERRARAMKIPFSNDKIINLPVEEFNELLSKYQLSEAQLTLIRDIRRRGKNKMAAQNCRKRKLDTIINLERSVSELKKDKSKLLKEKVEFIKSIRQMKQKLQTLYQEVFSRLRDEYGRPCSANAFSLQFATNGSVLVMPRTLISEPTRRQDRKQKDRKK